MKCFKMRNFLAVSIFIISATSWNRVSGQIPKSSKDASIVSEARYLHNNGQFGSAYTQDDGVEFKEESDANGDRRGSYSYIDPAGRRRTVTYTAGKDGFRASGDDIPPMPMTAAASAVVGGGDYDEPQYDEPSSSAQGRINLKRPKFNAPRYNINVPLAASRRDTFHNNINERVSQPQFSAAQNVPQSRQDVASNFNTEQQLISEPASDNLGGTAVASFNQMPRQSQTNINPSAPAQFNTIRFQYQSPSVATRNSVQSDPGERVQSRRYFSPGKYSLSRSPDGYTYTFSKD